MRFYFLMESRPSDTQWRKDQHIHCWQQLPQNVEAGEFDAELDLNWHDLQI